jgi:hypothetical protein
LFYKGTNAKAVAYNCIVACGPIDYEKFNLNKMSTSEFEWDEKW